MMSSNSDALKAYFSKLGGPENGLTIPDQYSKVWKDECMLCFCSCLCEGGLYINMKSLQAFCPEHLHIDYGRSGQDLYLLETGTKVHQTNEQEERGQKEQVDKMAIGVQGGFQTEDEGKYTVNKRYDIYVRSLDRLVSVDCDCVPEGVRICVEAIKGQDGVSSQTAMESWEEQRKVSKYADTLEQLPPSRTVPMDPTQWKCEETGVSDNLWLNLSTGHIGSGRPQWDGTGGNGAALRHYMETGKKYPLVVKLGTITPAGADVFSYASDEDDMVIDPKLGDHLSHWGINMLQMEKTEKSMTELQIEKNLNYELHTITEAGEDLIPLKGPGFVGLKNLGNSCYLNTVAQVLWTLPELKAMYVDHAQKIFESSMDSIGNDFLTQFVKLGDALCSTSQGCSRRTGEESDSAHCISPWMFKRICGRNHQEFSTNHQQDAQEFLIFLFEQLARNEHQNSERIGGLKSLTYFESTLESRVECASSHRVSYKQEKTPLLSLEIPIQDVEELSRSAVQDHPDTKKPKLDGINSDLASVKVSLMSCFERFFDPEIIEDYYSAFLRARGQAIKTQGIVAFPKYLFVHVRRYYVDETWTPKKLDVKLDVPESISLERFRSKGPQDKEILQPEETEEANEDIVRQLMDMGFPEQKCRKAVLATGNKEIDSAMEYILNDNEEEPEADPAAIQNLCDMGFTSVQVKKALKECGGNMERSVDWLFNHPMIENEPSFQEAAPDSSDSSRYELVAFISHIGKNTSSGHYVCHIKKDGIWTIFNDEKVAKSNKPPIELGYIYLFRQIS